MRRVVFVKPTTFVVVDQLAGDTRSIVVRHVGRGEPANCERFEEDGTLQMKLTAGDRVCELILPTGSGGGTIAVTEREKKLLPERPLPAGIMPHGPKGVAMIERWDAAYRGQRPAPWDSGQPNSRLTEVVEDGTIKPGRVAVLGCGSGTNAVFLATKGFEVTDLVGDFAETWDFVHLRELRPDGGPVREGGPWFKFNHLPGPDDSCIASPAWPFRAGAGAMRTRETTLTATWPNLGP